jgi:hypothetical protein
MVASLGPFSQAPFPSRPKCLGVFLGPTPMCNGLYVQRPFLDPKLDPRRRYAPYNRVSERRKTPHKPYCFAPADTPNFGCRGRCTASLLLAM